MKYSLLFSTIYYICGCFYMIFGMHALSSNTKSHANRLFLFVTGSLAIWSFTYSVANSAPTAESSAFWRCMSVFGWSFFHILLLHFALILTNHKFQLNKPINIITFYLPAFINVVLFAPFGLLAERQYKMVPSDFGWRNLLPANIGQYWINIYYISYTVITFIILIRWWKKLEPHTPLKRQVTYFLISILLPFIAGSITDILPGVLGLTQIPRLTLVFMMLPTIFLYIILKKHGILIEKAKIVYIPSDSVILSEENRLRLFETASLIFMIGAAGSFFTAYFIAGGNLKKELLLAVVVFIFGVFLKYMPYMTKNNTIQNKLFLMTSVVGMSFFIITNIDTGAITVWAIYTVFLLFTVVLNDDIHAFLFLVATLITQVVVWIIYPKVYAVIDSAQYMKRIFIIVLSFYAVRYLANEYSSKLQGYKRFAKEQELLEIISANFISINRENIKEKIDEMMKISAEILEFDNAYLFEFDASYENATILNMIAKDIESKSSHFDPGKQFKTADFPEAETLITQNTPLLCEDVTSISVEEAKDQRNFFMSRGINSFFALPVISDDKPIGFFVIEYSERSDKRFTESRIHFLKIIANILGDARKKIFYEERLYYYAYFDQTTKLTNRNMLKKRLEEIISNRKDSEKVAILDIDIENIRMLKDTFGNDTGEQIMKKSATILKNLLEECCEISRIGEGDFVIVLSNIKNTEQIEECVNRIIDSFFHPLSIETGIEALFVMVRIGISVCPDNGIDVDTLLKNADLAGYEARNADKRFLFYNTQIEKNIAENTLLTNKLFRSLQNEEFSLEFQPQVSCETGKTVGIEALLRWTTDDNQRVPPNRFVPMLEQTGLIYDVGLWVLEQALKEHNRLIMKGFSPLRISVNLSVVQFEGKDFIPDITKIIDESQVDPKYIELEITERLFSANPEDTINKLHKLKELGVKIAIDDFGKGYSSLNHLQLVPFDRIKIDKEIIDYIKIEEKSAPIMEVIILLGKTFRAYITAEGVETKEQVDFLQSIDCDEIQGYYFSKPLSSKALEEFLKKE
ncbi:MAG TPA: EAL domain-containing protein [Clostridiaceae bacterium]|nr:EAL domain-containing protein [Clostridiaceae bacterium]